MEHATPVFARGHTTRLIEIIFLQVGQLTIPPNHHILLLLLLLLLLVLLFLFFELITAMKAVAIIIVIQVRLAAHI